MTFVSRNSRVFLKGIPDDWQLVTPNAGKLRLFEDGMDGRCWGNNCFQRHSYLLELIAAKWNKSTADDPETAESSLPQVRSGRGFEIGAGECEGDPGKDSLGLPDAAGVLEQQQADHSVVKPQDTSRSRKGVGLLGPKQTRSVIVDVSQGGTRQQISVAVSCSSLARNSSKSMDDECCHCNPDVAFLQMKLTQVMNENEQLCRKIHAMEQTKCAYLYKIEDDLERYCQLCQKQKQSISALKGELRYMEEQVASLQECVYVRPQDRQCPCGREH